ncbi:hypothetical protein PENTCL1PPCAC_9325, partial [Pristionchus entomophagus]
QQQQQPQRRQRLRVQMMIGHAHGLPALLPAAGDPAADAPVDGAAADVAPFLHDAEDMLRDAMFGNDEVFGQRFPPEDDEEGVERNRAVAADVERTPPREIPARIDNQSEQEVNASCPICIMPFKNNADGARVARVLACGHLICTGCVKQQCRTLKENRSMAYHSYDRAPCVVCQRSVRWRNLPECKTVGYLYEQLELTNEQSPSDDTTKIRTEARKKACRHLDSISSSCHELATKMRKLVRKADRIYDQSLESSSHLVGRETIMQIDSAEQAKWLVEKVEEEANRIGALETQFNEHYEMLTKIVEELAPNSLTLPKVFPTI